MTEQLTHQHGIRCPECSFTIPTTMPMLLSDEPIVCPMCGLVLHIDRDKSADSFNLIRNLHEATQQVEKTQKQWR